MELKLKFIPRDYQLPIIDAIENKGYKKVVAVLPRRAGKDITAFNLAIRRCLQSPSTVYMIYPTYSQGRKIIWDAIDNDGRRILEYYLPKELIHSINDQQMKIRLKNSSLLQVLGSENADALVGTNCHAAIFSEYSLQNPKCYQLLRPILVASDGWCLFISTPRGRNHFYTLYNIAKSSKDWFAYKLTIEDTKHISLEKIEQEKDEGLTTEALIQQEYYCSFEGTYSGAFYAKSLDQMMLQERITTLDWNPTIPVITAWDVGVRDKTSIIFAQLINQSIHIIDFYEHHGEGLEHYVKVLNKKDYIYSQHIAPHDIMVKEFGSGMTRYEKAYQLGINFTIAPNISIMDGIECLRSILNRVWIDKEKCKFLVSVLENYRSEYDAKYNIFKDKPLHDQYSHAADALRYFAVSLPKLSDGLSSAKQLEERYLKAIYGESKENDFFSELNGHKKYFM